MLKVFSISISLSCLILLINFGCDNCGQNTEELFVETIPLYVETVNNSCRVINADSIKNGKSVDLIITKTDDYINHVKCVNDTPSVNFENHTLLAGKIYWPTCAKINGQTLFKTCDGYHLVTYIKTDISGGVLCGGESILYYFLLINKQSIGNISYENKETL